MFNVLAHLFREKKDHTGPGREPASSVATNPTTAVTPADETEVQYVLIIMRQPVEIDGLSTPQQVVIIIRVG